MYWIISDPRVSLAPQTSSGLTKNSAQKPIGQFNLIVGVTLILEFEALSTRPNAAKV